MKNISSSKQQPSARPRPAAPASNLKPTELAATPWQDEVARKAYFIYLSQGCPKGQDVQHWLEAEAQMMTPPKAGRDHLLF